MTSTCVLAVDGGNSKTAVAVADATGAILSSRVGPPSDIYSGTSPEAALASITTTVAAALHAAGVTASAPTAAVFSLAGADWPEDFPFLEAELTKRLGLAAPPLVVNDAIGGMRMGAPDGEGIAVVCGTFSAVGARRRDGRLFHCGFWPDRTGGFDLGMEAIKAVYREGLGLGPPTRLSEHALAVFDATDGLDLMHAFTRRENRRSVWEVQKLTPVLLDCADAGDAVAAAIVAQAGLWLGEQARVSAERVELKIAGTPVVLSGGVFRHPTTRLADAVMRQLPGGVLVRSDVPPLVGALLLGFDALGCAMDTDRLAANLTRAPHA